MTRALVFFTMLAAWTGWALPANASRILTDESGRKVTVPDHPHRVVCLLPSVTDTVFALVLRATSDLQVVPIMDNGAQGQTELRGRKRQATNATGNQPSQQLGGLA